MSEQQIKYIGCLKFSGELVQEGMLDARKSAQALLGFDEAVRFFVGYQSPDLRMSGYELPVRIRKGSWEVSIPENIGQLVIPVLGTAVFAYIAAGAKKMAENDFENIGMKDVFKKALEAIQWFIRIVKHTGDATLRKFNTLKFEINNYDIGLPNSEAEYLYVPKRYYDMYLAANPNLLKQLAELVEDERVLSIGVYDNDELVEEKITRKYRHVFLQEDDEPEELLFPDLHHGMHVVLEGEVTRGNETTNSLGLRYEGHILSASPQEGSIVRFKRCLFVQCRVHGTITRMDEKGRITAKKPKIIIERIEPLETDSEKTLF